MCSARTRVSARLGGGWRTERPRAPHTPGFDYASLNAVRAVFACLSVVPGTHPTHSSTRIPRGQSHLVFAVSSPETPLGLGVLHPSEWPRACRLARSWELSGRSPCTSPPGSGVTPDLPGGGGANPNFTWLWAVPHRGRWNGWWAFLFKCQAAHVPVCFFGSVFG